MRQKQIGFFFSGWPGGGGRGWGGGFISCLCSLLAECQKQFVWRPVVGQKWRCEASVQRIDSFTDWMNLWSQISLKQTWPSDQICYWITPVTDLRAAEVMKHWFIHLFTQRVVIGPCPAIKIYQYIWVYTQLLIINKLQMCDGSVNNSFCKF